MADTHIYLELDDVKGESTAAGFVERAEIQTVRWGLSARNSQTVDEQTAAAQLDYDLVTLTKHFDNASLACLKRTARSDGGGDQRRQGFETAKISYVDVVLDPDSPENAKSVPVVEIVLKHGYIEDYQLSTAEGSRSIRVEETIKLSYRSIRFSYYRAVDGDRGRRHAVHFDGETAVGDD